MLEDQSVPSGLVTWMVWLSEIGPDSCRYSEFSMRRSYPLIGAYNGRRLNPRLLTAMRWPSAVTWNADAEGSVNCELESTKFHWVTAAGSGCLVVISFSSSIVGLSTCNEFAPTGGICKPR